MIDDWVDRVGDIIAGAEANDWIVAAAAGTLALILVLLALRIVGFLFRRIGCLLALAVGASVALFVLDRRGLPGSIGGGRIDRWIDDVRRSIGV
jgi:hypothetical protein